tara:strand:- start:7537 stop:8355 length:819 start_codon:yes stop_codon:yes gene_type:complete
MLKIDTEIFNKIKHTKNAKTWVNEANFALEHITSPIKQLPNNSNVLEIGSGSGILLSFLKKSFPNINFIGIEPLGDDFITLKDFHQNLLNLEDSLIITSFENFSSSQKFDFIFLINVFEHLDNWKDFYKFLNSRLSDRGKCLILCPNYSFPFETHFNIPILITKKMTYKLFKKYIDNFERENNAFGLWNSLNFITYARLIKFSKINNLQVFTHNDITVNLVNRLDYDSEFKSRNPLLGSIAKILRAIGVLNLIKLKIFRYIDPYIKVELSKK